MAPRISAIFGAAGCAREIEWILNDVYMDGGPDYRPGIFVAEDSSPQLGGHVNGRPIISESEFIARHSGAAANCFVAVADPGIRRNIVGRIEAVTNARFPSVLHPTVVLDRREAAVSIGNGTIIGAGCVLMTKIRLGSFVYVNVGCTIGHDTIIQDYCTLSPGVHVSGNVALGESVFMGTGSVVLDKLSVSSKAIVGAGAVVISDIAAPGTHVGVPARRVE